MPVFLFAVSQAERVDWTKAAIAFAILHFLVYPSSNGYNSYMDRDESPIGGLKKPLQPTKQLFYVSIAMDILALILSLFLGIVFFIGVTIYILASRAYSYRGIRLKKYPIIGFLTVFIFQGALIYYITFDTISDSDLEWLPILVSSLLIGALYPLTQVYQHEEDARDGVNTISMLVGKRGSFILSGLMFLSATLLLYTYFDSRDLFNHFKLFLFILLPVVLFFCYWMIRVWNSGKEANFKNSLIMNLVSTVCTTIYFITLIILNH